MFTTPWKLKHLTGLLMGAFLLAAGLNTCTMQSPQAIAAPTLTNAERTRYRLAAQYSRNNGGLSMVVYKSGQLVFESYTLGVRPSQGNQLASGTKSFACAIAVLGAQEGLLTLDEPVANTIPEWRNNPQKSTITIRQLLNMTSGLARGTIGSTPTYAAAINAPITAPIGQSFHYGPNHPQAFAEVMRRKLVARGIAQNPLQYLNARIFSRIGLRYERWRNSPDGRPNFASGAVINAREWGKFGVLILNRGRWQGQQLLNPNLLNQCFQGSSVNPAYGLTFWLNRNGFLPSGNPFLPVPAAANARMAIGSGNQLLVVLPAQNLVVVRQGRLGQATPGELEGSFDRVNFLNLVLTGVGSTQ